MLHDVMMTNTLKREGVTDLVTGRKIYCRSFSVANGQMEKLTLAGRKISSDSEELFMLRC